MDTTTYAVVAMVNSVAYDPRSVSPVIPEPEFQSFNLAQLALRPTGTGDTETRSGDYHGNVSNALSA
jgi:hypothetical protein